MTNDEKGFRPHHLALLIVTAIIIGALAKGCPGADKTPHPQPSTIRTAIQHEGK